MYPFAFFKNLFPVHSYPAFIECSFYFAELNILIIIKAQ